MVRRLTVVFLDPLSLHHCAFGDLPGMPSPYAFIITGLPITSYLLNSENVWRAREPVDSRSPRLNGPGPSDSTARNTVFRKVPRDRATAVPASRTFFLALLLLLLCRCLFRLLHRLAKLFDRLDTRRFQAVLCNIPPHRRVIQRVLQSSSLKHQEGVVFRSSFHPCMRWLWRGSLPRQIRRTPLLRTDPYLIVCCLDGSGTCIDRPAIDCRVRGLPRAFSHTNNQVRRVLIERQPISSPLQERFLYFFLGLTVRRRVIDRLARIRHDHHQHRLCLQHKIWKIRLLFFLRACDPRRHPSNLSGHRFFHHGLRPVLPPLSWKSRGNLYLSRDSQRASLE